MKKLKLRIIKVRFNTAKGCIHKIFDSMFDCDEFIQKNKHKLGILAFQIE